MIIIATLYGTTETTLILIIGLLSWMSTARVVRAQVKSLRERPYVRRTRALGATHTRILGHHILPQIAPLLAASAALALAIAILSEAALSFLGLGPFGRPSWGSMIALNFNGGAIPTKAWWVIIPPGVAIGAVILCATLFARSFESALNPRLLVSHLGRRPFGLRPKPSERIAVLEAMTRRSPK
jgi:peptide/nickel transport system permease protein